MKSRIRGASDALSFTNVCANRRRSLHLGLLAAAACLLYTLPSHAVLVVAPTTSGPILASALGGTGLTLDAVSATNGDAGQFGTYSGFSSGPVTFPNGVVLSTGNVIDTPGPASPNDLPSTEFGSGGTTEFDAYGPGNIENFSDSNDVARLQVDFTLGAPGAVAFDFIFGSAEFPNFTSEFTDAFLAFLDGTSNQIVFDSLNDPVQVGLSFASQLTTADQNTAFGDPHGLLKPLTTTTAILDAGAHSILFEVGDVNDERLDSAVFISNFRIDEGSSGPGTTPTVPIPAAAWLFGSGILGLMTMVRRGNHHRKFI